MKTELNITKLGFKMESVKIIFDYVYESNIPNFDIIDVPDLLNLIIMLDIKFDLIL